MGEVADIFKVFKEFSTIVATGKITATLDFLGKSASSWPPARSRRYERFSGNLTSSRPLARSRPHSMFPTKFSKFVATSEFGATGKFTATFEIFGEVAKAGHFQMQFFFLAIWFIDNQI